MDKSLEKQLTSWLRLQKKACGFYLNLTVLFGLLTGLSLIIQAYLLSTILHGVIILELDKSHYTHEFILLLVLIPIRALLAFARERACFESGKRLRLQIRSAVLDKLTELGPAFIKGKPVGSWASIVLEQVEDLHDFYARYLPQIILAGFIPLTILIVVFPLNWAAGLILLATAPLIPMFMILVGMGAADANRKNFSALAKLSGHFMDRLKGLPTLKLFNRGDAEVKEIETASEEFRERTMSVLRMAFLSSAVLEFFSAVSIAVLAVYFGFSYLGHLNFGDYNGGVSLFIGLFVLMLAPEFYQPLRDMGTHYHAKAQAIGAAEELMALLEYRVESNSVESKSGGKEIKHMAVNDKAIDWQAGVEIEARDLKVLSHDGATLVGPVSFHLSPGQHVAIVGPSGSGKTSLLNAMLGFLPYEGSLKVNGLELSELDMTLWRRHLAWLGQDPQLFHGTVRDNVAMADVAMGDEAIKLLLEKANILEFVEQQSLGLSHPIGEQMAGLSVGQAQRIALARALGQDAHLYLLDEPTASLDSHSEQAVLSTLWQAMDKTSCLMVTHRLDQLHQMDTILVLDAGAIVQRGSFEDLNRAEGLFKLMQEDETDVEAQANKESNS
ncbi:heme ABC transporter permease/ATP-binding protein CydD [Shewanella violacea]|uniref:ABC transporter, ATP-binding protein CydD n=1 Tax=Shewanella violacea (strain JCM 10179 / CIP 106290 / LMG 19151 / DSS12) TaxID=637905 RepID=D4ZFP8_SHEVD|nr:cysteine/glutathione ABC transporter permease/ATP-binding protein CydD [Shewanella violacea]BAJ00497.1 ABC transporter, ATP-binding protein CydD [Shewanella violacea DSS12]